MINFPNNASQTNRSDSASQAQQYQARQTKGFQHTQSPFQGNLLLLILSLLQLLLQQINQGNGGNPQPPQPQPLNLNQNQENNLKNLLGLTPGAPIGVQILDQDSNGQVSIGDIAIASGGITGGEISRKTLTADDVAAINQTAQIPPELTANRQAWNQANANANSVSYTFQQTCFCPQDFTRPMNITEQNNQIISATYADTGEAVPQNIVDGLLTVDQRFAQLEEAYAGNADNINVSYDTNLGYPSSVFIDQSFMIADEEINYTINNLNIN